MQQIDQQELNELKQVSDLADALARLQLHPDFVTVFDKHLFNDELKKLVLDKVSLSDVGRKINEEQLLSISYLKQHLSSLKIAGLNAKRQISEIMNEE